MSSCRSDHRSDHRSDNEAKAENEVRLSLQQLEAFLRLHLGGLPADDEVKAWSVVSQPMHTPTSIVYHDEVEAWL